MPLSAGAKSVKGADAAGEEDDMERPLLKLLVLWRRRSSVILLGRFDQIPFISEDGALFVPPDRLVETKLRYCGKWSRLALLTAVGGEAAGLLAPGRYYPYLLYDDFQAAELVLSPQLTWKETVFHPMDAVSVPWGEFRVVTVAPEGGVLPEGAEVIKGGWDHMHCGICNACICEMHGPEAAVSNEDAWVCRACYQRHVLTKNIDFDWCEEGSDSEGAG